MIYEKGRGGQGVDSFIKRVSTESMAEILSLRSDRDYMITAGMVVPSPGDAPIAGGIVAIHRGQIQAVLEGMSPLPAPYLAPSRERLDLSGLVLFPCLMDSHVHLSIRTAGNPRESLEQSRRVGVAAVRDGGDRDGATLREKERLSNTGVQVYAAGWALHGRGGYGGFLGRAISNREDFDANLMDLLDHGADFLKIIGSGIVDFETGRVSEPSPFQDSELRWMVRRARERGLWVMAHANADLAVESAIRAGVRSLEHGYLISREAIKRMADAGVYWVPTLLPVFRLGQSRTFRQRSSSAASRNLRRIYRRHEENIALAHELGVRLVVGTDAGAPGIAPGPSLHEELGLMVRAGLSPQAALRAASALSAEMMHPDADPPLGTIAPGKKASFLALHPDGLLRLPTPDDIRFIVTVR